MIFLSDLDRKLELRFLLESNAIEGVYDLHSLSAALSAWRHLLKEDSMSVASILRAHSLLMDGKLEDEYVGQFRDCDVWIGSHKGLKPELVESAMLKFVGEINVPIEQKNLEVYDKFKDLHIAFERVHPFVDGNGRIGRMLWNWHRVKNGYPLEVVLEKDRFDYYRWFK